MEIRLRGKVDTKYMLKHLNVLDMDRVVILEHEIDKLRQKFKYVDELRHRVNNLENWITANVGKPHFHTWF